MTMMMTPNVIENLMTSLRWFTINDAAPWYTVVKVSLLFIRVVGSFMRGCVAISLIRFPQHGNPYNHNKTRDPTRGHNLTSSTHNTY